MNKIISKVFSGLLLAYFGLSDLENFHWLYNGLAIAASIIAFLLAFIEYRKQAESK